MNKIKNFIQKHKRVLGVAAIVGTTVGAIAVKIALENGKEKYDVNYEENHWNHGTDYTERHINQKYTVNEVLRRSSEHEGKSKLDSRFIYEKDQDWSELYKANVPLNEVTNFVDAFLRNEELANEKDRVNITFQKV